MIKKIIIILIIFNITNIVKASTKNEIIINLQKIKNISFDFKQTVDDKMEEGTCTIQYPKKIYCSYNNFKKKIIVSNGKSCRNSHYNGNSKTKCCRNNRNN